MDGAHVSPQNPDGETAALGLGPTERWRDRFVCSSAANNDFGRKYHRQSTGGVFTAIRINLWSISVYVLKQSQVKIGSRHLVEEPSVGPQFD